MTLEQLQQTAAPVCRELQVKRLDLFGSLARGEGNATSNVDLLVEFDPAPASLHTRFFTLLHQLEDALDRKVDLLTLKGLKNPYFRRRVLAEKVNVYGG